MPAAASSGRHSASSHTEASAARMPTSQAAFPARKGSVPTRRVLRPSASSRTSRSRPIEPAASTLARRTRVARAASASVWAASRRHRSIPRTERARMGPLSAARAPPLCGACAPSEWWVEHLPVGTSLVRSVGAEECEQWLHAVTRLRAAWQQSQHRVEPPLKRHTTGPQYRGICRAPQVCLREWRDGELAWRVPAIVGDELCTQRLERGPPPRHAPRGGAFAHNEIIHAVKVAVLLDVRAEDAHAHRRCGRAGCYKVEVRQGRCETAASLLKEPHITLLESYQASCECPEWANFARQKLLERRGAGSHNNIALQRVGSVGEGCHWWKRAQVQMESVLGVVEKEQDRANR